MEVQKTKRRVVSSSAMLISIILHLVVFLMIGGMVALKFYEKQDAGFIVEEPKPRLERRRLQMPVKTQPFMEQMSKPKRQTTTRLTANAPQMVNIPEQGEYVKMAPPPTFKGAYTNFLDIDQTLEFNAKYRTVDFGVSQMNFFGTRGKAEKVVIVIDASKAMLYDKLGGVESYQMIQDDLSQLINRMRSATLFNVVLFDGDKVAQFNPTLQSASHAAKTNALNWVSGVNTNLSRVGLTDERANYKPTHQYDMPMQQSDITGWLKGVQAAFEMKPEVVFMLGSDWGGITAVQSGASYFKRSEAYEAYQKRRADHFLKDEGFAEEMDEYLAEFDEYKAIALKMLELENRARAELDMQPKVVRDWDQILLENDAELPPPPLMETDLFNGIHPADTRYTFGEVVQSLFVMAMDQYREKGLPQLNFVLLRSGSSGQNSTAAASLMTSDAKFKILTRILSGRFRYLRSRSPISNELDQDKDDIRRLLEEENQTAEEI